MTLFERAVKAHGITTKKGKVADHLPLSAVYGLLCALEYGSTDGIRPEDRKAFLALMDNTKKMRVDLNAGDDALMNPKDGKGALMTAGFTSAGYGNGRVERYGSLTLTERGERWARRLLNLLQTSQPAAPEVKLIDCKGCNTLHRNDTMCPW